MLTLLLCIIMKLFECSSKWRPAEVASKGTPVICEYKAGRRRRWPHFHTKKKRMGEVLKLFIFKSACVLVESFDKRCQRFNDVRERLMGYCCGTLGVISQINLKFVKSLLGPYQSKIYGAF